jgi:hypothetical protein
MHMKDGTTYEEKVLANRGGPGNPLSDDELKLKFTLNAGQKLKADQAETLAGTIFGLEQEPSLDRLLSLTVAE